MTRSERIAYYRRILLEASSRDSAVAEILADVDTLVWENPRRPLSKAERLAILKEIFEDTRFIKSFPSFEYIDRVHGSVDSINEADNSHILDVISALKKGAKD